MPTTLHIAGLPSQSLQGVGARLVRRLGGAVWRVIVRAITLAGTLRRPAVPQTARHHPEAQDPQAPARRPVRVPRRPRPALPAPLVPPPVLAHLLAARRHHRPVATSRPACLNQGDKPFTPEARPQLSPQASAVLNTPLKDRDPKTLELVFSTFSSPINRLMSPEAGMTDPAAKLPNLWHRLNAAPGDTEAETCLSTTPQPVPATPADEVPDAPVAPPQKALTTGPTTPSAKDAPRLSPLPLSGRPASDPPPDAAICAPAPRTTPHIAPVRPASRSLSNPGQSLPHHTQSFMCRRRRHVPSSHPLSPQSLRDALQCLPPPSRLYYAASIRPPERPRPESGECQTQLNGATPQRPRHRRFSSSQKSNPLPPFSLSTSRYSAPLVPQPASVPDCCRTSMRRA
jgi:hypothetical protein